MLPSITLKQQSLLRHLYLRFTCGIRRLVPHDLLRVVDGVLAML